MTVFENGYSYTKDALVTPESSCWFVFRKMSSGPQLPKTSGILQEQGAPSAANTQSYVQGEEVERE